MDDARARPGTRLLVTLALVVGFAGLFLFAHPYRGIEHDAILYALQALRHLEPQALGDDLFFRHGSQDAYTLFSPIYASLVQWTGLEPAAYLIARLSLLALFGAALFLARRLMKPDLAWLALGLFVAIPGSYGADNVLKYAENFATPRTLTEALVLTALALRLARRPTAAWAAVGFGFLLHPLMAVPGLIACALVQAPRKAVIGILATGAIAVALMVLVAVVAPFGLIRFIDPLWHQSIAAMVPYLLVEQWSISDWQPTVIGLATLVTAIRVLPDGSAKKIATVGALVGTSGMVLAAIASVAPVALLVQGQAWRWMWLGKALAVLLLVPIAISCWQRGTLARAAMALLAVGWFARNDAIGVIAGLLALLALTLDAGAMPAPRRRFATWALATLAALLGLAALKVHWLPIELLLVLAVVATWAIARAQRFPVRLAGIAAAFALGGLQIFRTVSLPGDVSVVPHYSSNTIQEFSSWRERIGDHQTVFFPEHPEMVWLVLHRKSYAAYAAPAFSRETALETWDRFKRIESLTVPVAGAESSSVAQARSASPEGMLRACQADDIDFIITRHQFPAPFVGHSVPGALSGFVLYACSDIRAAQSGHRSS